jgi:hypothetical protein
MRLCSSMAVHDVVATQRANLTRKKTVHRALALETTEKYTGIWYCVSSFDKHWKDSLSRLGSARGGCGRKCRPT